jgi:anaerobic magnesium-protoporphyrin IX monomethyl ester cyclase
MTCIRKSYPLIKDLDELPMIDYSLVDMRKYDYISPFHMSKPAVGIITSRGCPENCIFCTVKGVWGRTWRGKSAERVVYEIGQLYSMGYREFSILDDSFSVDKQRLELICSYLITADFKIRWSTPNGIAHWTLDKELLKLMKESGCYRITLGIESGNAEVRKFIGKNHSLDQAKQVIKWANQLGMWTIATTIIGFPGETKEQMLDTLEFVKSSGVDFATFFTLDVYPTADIAKYPVDLTLAKEMQFKLYRSFIIHRLLTAWNIVFKIRSWEDFKYTLKLIKAGFNITKNSLVKKTTKELLYAR